MIARLIKQCIRNISIEIEENPMITQLLDQEFQPTVKDSLLKLRVKFLLLLDQDENTRRELVEKTTKERGNFGPIPLSKANAFYQELHGKLLPMWISNETVSMDHFIDQVRMAYLIA